MKSVKDELNPLISGSREVFLRGVRKDSTYFWFGELVIFVLCFLWFSKGVVLFDDGYFPFSPFGALARNVSVWNYYNFPGGMFYASFFYLPFILFMSVFSTIFHLPLSLSEGLYVFSLLGVGFYGIFNLTKLLLLEFTLEQSRLIKIPLGIIAMPGSLFYVLNYFQVFSYGAEFYPSLILFNFFPLFILAFLRYLLDDKIISKQLGVMSVSATLMAAGFFEAPFLLWTVALFLFFAYIFSFKLKLKCNAKTLMLKFSFASILFLAGMVWTLYALYYASASAYVIHTSKNYGGYNLFAYIFAYNTPLQTIPAIFTSFALGLPSPSISAISFPSAQLVSSSYILELCAAFPVIVALSSIVFVRNFRWAKTLTLSLILLILISSRIVDLSFLLQINNFILDGIVFAFTPEYAGIPAYASFPLMFVIALLDGFSLWYILDHLTNVKVWLLSILKRVRLDSWFLSIKNYIFKRDPNFASHKRKYFKREGTTVQIIILVISLLIFAIAFFPVALSPEAIYNDPSGTHIASNFDPPNSFTKLIDYLQSSHNANNVLTLPLTVGESTSLFGNSSYWSVYPPISSSVGGSVLYRDKSFNSSWMTYPILKFFPYVIPYNFTSYLTILGVKYIVVNTDSFGGTGNPPHNAYAGVYPWNFTLILSILNRTEGLQLVFQDSPFYMYTVTYPVPVIYGAEGIYLNSSNEVNPLNVYRNYTNDTLEAGKQVIIRPSSNDQVLPKTGVPISVKYTKISDDHYNAVVRSNGPFFVTLDTGFSNYWCLTFANGSVDAHHFEANAYANSWLVPAGNYSVTIYIPQQVIQNELFLVSLLTISIVMSAIIAQVFISKMREREYDNGL